MGPSFATCAQVSAQPVAVASPISPTMNSPRSPAITIRSRSRRLAVRGRGVAGLVCVIVIAPAGSNGMGQECEADAQLA